MTVETMRFVRLGQDNLHMLPGRLLSRRCAECLHWEDRDFWSSGDPPAILETRKRAWFQRVLSEFGTCGIVALEGTVIVAFTEYAPPGYFPGIAEYPIEAEPDLPFVACLSVARDRQGRGIGRQLLAEVEQDLQQRGFRGAQSLARKAGFRTPAGPVEFWLARGYTVLRETDEIALVVKTF